MKLGGSRAVADGDNAEEESAVSGGKKGRREGGRNLERVCIRALETRRGTQTERDTDRSSVAEHQMGKDWTERKLLNGDDKAGWGRGGGLPKWQVVSELCTRGAGHTCQPFPSINSKESRNVGHWSNKFLPM